MRLKRPIQPMPACVRRALKDRNLEAQYASRPPYQRNDYLGWINRAKLSATQQKRLNIMLDELQTGKGYMGMDWHPRSER